LHSSTLTIPLHYRSTLVVLFDDQSALLFFISVREERSES